MYLFFPVGIVSSGDGYFIYGDHQYLSGRSNSFIMKLNKEGEVLFYIEVLLSSESSIYGLTMLSDSTFVTYGQVIMRRTSDLHMRFQGYRSDNGRLISYATGGLALNMYNLFQVDNGAERYVGISSYINQNTTSFFAHAVWYDKDFKSLRRTEFGIRDPDGWKKQSYELHFQFTMDAEGNIYMRPR